MANDSRISAEIFAEFPDGINTPELHFELTEGENFWFIESLFAEANFPDDKMITIDGMRIVFSNGRELVRDSNTTPSHVVRFEADTKEAPADIQEQFSVNEENKTRYSVTFLSVSTLEKSLQSKG